MKRIKLIAMLACVVVMTDTLWADTQVKDGDDILIDGQDYRFVTVDAFEPGQICKDAHGRDYDCGARAKETLEQIIGNQPVQCQTLKDTDRKYSRCSAGTTDLEVEIVRAGWGFPRRDFKPHDPERFAELCAIEKEAREAKRGAWSGTFEIPFLQKRGTRKRVAQISCPGFPLPPQNSTQTTTYTRMLEIAAHWAAIFTALIAAFAYGRYLWERYKKRLRLENYLRKEKESLKDKGQRTVMHLSAELGMTETEIVDAAFRSRHIGRTVSPDEKGHAAKMLLEYKAQGTDYAKAR